MIETITTRIFHLFKERNENVLLFQLFGPVLFLAHVYGSFAAADARSLAIRIDLVLLEKPFE